MPEQTEDSGSRETTKPSIMKRFAEKLGKRIFPIRQKRAREPSYDTMVKKGYKPGTIEWWTMPEGGRSLEEYERKLMFGRDELDGGVVLDLGAGPTLRLANDLEAAGIDARVVSLSADFSDEKYRRVAGDHADGLVVAGLAQALPFKDGSFDKIVALHLSEHLLTEDIRRKTLSEAARVLRPGGTARFGTTSPQDRICDLVRDDEKLHEYLNGLGVQASIVPHVTIRSRLYDDYLGMACGEAPAVVIVLRKGESDMSDASQRSVVSL